MATDQEKQEWLDTRAASMLVLYAQFMPLIKLFVTEYQDLQGIQRAEVSDNPFPIGDGPDEMITIMGATATGKSLYDAFQQLEAMDQYIDQSDIDFIQQLLASAAAAAEV